MPPLQHLVQSIFGGRYPRGIIFLMSGHYFTCHWDESGSDPGTGTKPKSDRPILLVGGYFGHVREWEMFENEWKPILSEYGLSQFHMVDFANLNQPYGGWNQEQREGLISSLLGVIAKYPRLSVAWAIEIDAYMEIIKARHLLETDIVRAYHICAKKCIETVHNLTLVAGYTEKILHIFDHGNAAWPSFEASFTDEMLETYNILKPIAQSKRDIVSLQSADILAHQVARNLLISAGKIPEGQRLYTTTLLGKPGFQRWIDVKELARLYREELVLENARAHGYRPRRVVRNVQQTQKEIISELFKEPQDYQLNSLLRELQTGIPKDKKVD